MSKRLSPKRLSKELKRHFKACACRLVGAELRWTEHLEDDGNIKVGAGDLYLTDLIGTAVVALIYPVKLPEGRRSFESRSHARSAMISAAVDSSPIRLAPELSAWAPLPRELDAPGPVRTGVQLTRADLVDDNY